MTTTIILLSVFRKFFESINLEDSKETANDITSKYIGRITETREEQTLYLGESDRIFLKDVIQVKNPIIPKEKLSNSQKRIIFASDFFIKKLNEKLNDIMSETSKYNYLNKIYKVFIEQFNILAVKTDDINEAFIIFETLNARGKDLETADLLKNHLFRISDSKIDDIKEEWKIMLSKLGKIDPTTYIRHYWNSQNIFLREKDLYKIMRKNITSPKKCFELVKDLSFLAEVYSNLVNPREESYFSNDINKKLIILKDLSAKTFYPILLALTKQNFEDKEILKILSVLEVLVVRNFVVAQKVTNIYELKFSKIAFKISQEKLIKIDDII